MTHSELGVVVDGCIALFVDRTVSISKGMSI
jgi:hypothetical protein